MRLFVDGKWTGKEDRTINVREADGSVVTYNVDEYAKEHGITLPDSKHSKKHKDIKKEVNSNADMEQSHHSGDSKVDGNGDSEGSE